MSIESDVLAASDKAVAVVEQPAPVEEIAPEALLALASSGDLSKLTSEQKLQFYLHRCKQAGLDPSTSPFQYISMNGKLVLYAKREAADQICANRNYSIEKKSMEIIGDVLYISVGISDPSGRKSEDIAAVFLKGLTGQELANAHMKCFTKAKRRAVLSFSGLGMLDESEIKDVNAQRGDVRNLPSPVPQAK